MPDTSVIAVFSMVRPAVPYGRETRPTRRAEERKFLETRMKNYRGKPSDQSRITPVDNRGEKMKSSSIVVPKRNIVTDTMKKRRLRRAGHTSRGEGEPKRFDESGDGTKPPVG